MVNHNIDSMQGYTRAVQFRAIKLTPFLITIRSCYRSCNNAITTSGSIGGTGRLTLRKTLLGFNSFSCFCYTIRRNIVLRLISNSSIGTNPQCLYISILSSSDWTMINLHAAYFERLFSARPITQSIISFPNPLPR